MTDEPAAEAFAGKPVEDKRAQDLAYERWFRSKVLAGIVNADAGHFASDTEINETLDRWR